MIPWESFTEKVANDPDCPQLPRLFAIILMYNALNAEVEREFSTTTGFVLYLDKEWLTIAVGLLVGSDTESQSHKNNFTVDLQAADQAALQASANHSLEHFDVSVFLCFVEPYDMFDYRYVVWKSYWKSFATT